MSASSTRSLFAGPVNLVFRKSTIQKPFDQLLTQSRRTLSVDGKKKTSRGPISWASLAVFLLAGGGIVAYVRYEKEKKEEGLFILLLRLVYTGC